MPQTLQNESLPINQQWQRDSVSQSVDHINRLHEVLLIDTPDATEAFLASDTALVRPQTTEAFLASDTRRALYASLRTMYDLSDKNLPISPEVETRFLGSLTKFLNENSYNERILLYLPNRVLPTLGTSTHNESLEQAKTEFQNTYMSAWEHQLEQGNEENAQQIAALLPLLLQCGIARPDKLPILMNHELPRVRQSIYSQIPQLIEGGFLTVEDLLRANPMNRDDSLGRRNDVLNIQSQVVSYLIKHIQAGEITQENFPHATCEDTQLYYSTIASLDLLCIAIQHGITLKIDLPRELHTLLRDDFRRIDRYSTRSDKPITTPTLLSVLIAKDKVSIESFIAQYSNFRSSQSINQERARSEYIVHTIAHLVSLDIITRENFPSELWSNLVSYESDSNISDSVTRVLPLLLSKKILTRESFPNDLWKSCFLPGYYPNIRKTIAMIAAVPSLIEQHVLPLERWKLLFEYGTLASLSAARAIGPLVVQKILSTSDFHAYLRHTNGTIQRHAIRAIMYLGTHGALTAELLPRDVCLGVFNNARSDQDAILSALPSVLKSGILTQSDIELLQLSRPNLHLPRGIFQHFDRPELLTQLHALNTAMQISDEDLVLERVRYQRKTGTNVSTLSPNDIIFPGYIIVGSISKGYWRRGADFDIAVIFRTTGKDEEDKRMNALLNFKLDQAHVQLCSNNGIIQISEQMIDPDSWHEFYDNRYLLSNLLQGELVDPSGELTELRSKFLTLLRKAPADKRDALLSAIETQTINGNLLLKGMQRVLPREEEYTHDSPEYKQIASLLFISKVCY